MLIMELRNSSQLLVMIQGEAGSGKSTLAKTFAEELKMKLLFAATTETAAAPLKAITINSLFALGLSKDKIEVSRDTVSINSKLKIKQKLTNIDILSLMRFQCVLL